MNRLLTILLLLGATAHGQINNPPTSVNIVDATATGRAVLTATNAAAARTSLDLGGFRKTDGEVFAEIYSGEDLRIVAGDSIEFYEAFGFGGTNAAAFASDSRASLGLGATWLTNTSATNFRTAIGLGATNDVTFSNVTVNGNISVGSLTTTTPSTWALDATQTAAATNGRLTLPSNANVIRLTNNNAISSVTNGVLGAFYFIVNQATNAVTISNVGGITIDGAQNLTLSPNESATLVATGATNASVAARGDLNDVALGGTQNTAPSQTASSGSSLMTRALTDQRQIDRMIAGPRMVWLTTFTGWETAVSGGSVAQNIFLRPSSGTNQWNYAIARSWQSGELFTGSGDVFNFSKAGGYGTALYSPGAIYRDGTGIIFLGAAYDYLPSTGSAVSNPATKGFGWRIKDESIVATMFNTNYVEVATNSAVLSSGATTRENVWLYIDWNGSGGATWYVNGSSVASTTNGPTGLTSVNQGYLIFGAVADVGLAQQNGLSISAFVLDREP